jgi:iron complex transport system substrate-binding protein
MKYYSEMILRSKVKKWVFISLLLIACHSCNINQAKREAIETVAENQIVSKAERLSILRNNDFTTVTIINPWQGVTGINLVYNLVRRGSVLPEGIDSSTVIYVPLKKIICMSTTHVAMIAALGEEESICGVSGTGFLYSGSLLENVRKGLIEDVGYEANLNKELILKLSPDLIMMYGIGSESAAYVGKIKELGVKVLFNADYLETDPLSKAEWIKLFGALYDKELKADSIYKEEVKNYNQLKAFVSGKITSRPKVMLGLPFKDTWYISPGNSFISKLIGDAGGEYLWSDTESAVSMPYGIENVYMRALTADFWLNIGSISSKDEITIVDERMTSLNCFIMGNLYNNNRRVTDMGGNDYWESGSLNPHLILKDIATILHPELFSTNELLYYRKIN